VNDFNYTKHTNEAEPFLNSQVSGKHVAYQRFLEGRWWAIETKAYNIDDLSHIILSNTIISQLYDNSGKIT